MISLLRRSHGTWGHRHGACGAGRALQENRVSWMDGLTKARLRSHPGSARGPLCHSEKVISSSWVFISSSVKHETGICCWLRLSTCPISGSSSVWLNNWHARGFHYMFPTINYAGITCLHLPKSCIGKNRNAIIMTGKISSNSDTNRACWDCTSIFNNLTL